MLKKVGKWTLIVLIGAGFIGAIVDMIDPSLKEKTKVSSEQSKKKSEQKIKEKETKKKSESKKQEDEKYEGWATGYVYHFKKGAEKYLKDSITMTTDEKTKALGKIQKDLVTANTNMNRRDVNPEEVATEWYEAGLPLADLKYVSQAIKEEVMQKSVNQ